MIEKEANAKEEKKSRSLLNYAKRQYAMGNVETAMKYARRVATVYRHTEAAVEANAILNEWKESEPLREWTDVTGQFKTIAKFVRLERGSVYLESKTAKVIAVELERLSRPDQRYVMDREGL